MRDHVDAIRSDSHLLHEPKPAVLAVGDNGIDPLVELSLSGATSRTPLPRQHVMGRENERTPTRQQMQIELLQGQPLEVNDVGGSSDTTVGQHVRNVLKGLGHSAQARVAKARGTAVKQLLVSVVVC
jgi:hypothetical protein